MTTICLDGSTENAGPENGGPKKHERTENAGLKMKDQMSGWKMQDLKMQDQNTRTENGGPTAGS